MVEEYYVRPPDSDTARGPFDIPKLQTLAEAGQVTRETLYYDDDFQSWAAIGSNEDLHEKVFPSKKKLKLRAGDVKLPGAAPTTSEKDEYANPETVSVDEILAAAEGQTVDTRHIRDRTRWRHRAAALSIPVLGTISLISALTFIYPSWPTVQLILENDPGALTSVVQHPVMILGLLDLFFAVCLFLAATEVYPLLRFRAMLGSGFFAFIYWSQSALGNPEGLLIAGCMIAYGVGVYVCTLTLNFKIMVLAAAAGFAGVLGFAYFTTLAPLLAG